MWRRLRALVSRLPFVVSRDRLCDEAAAELDWHRERLTERFMASGMAQDEAQLAAARQLGNVTLVREDIYRLNGVPWLDALSQDLRHALRLFRRAPSFAAVIVVTLALGIGANSALLSIAYAVLVKPLPYADPGELYSVEIVVPERREQIPSLPATVQTFLAWRQAGTAFSGLAALTVWEASITGDGEPERIGGARVSANFFSLLGVPIDGRGFLAEEERPGRERVVIISDGLWRRRFGASLNTVGRTITINGEPHEIVGIAPSSLLVPTGTELHALLAFAPHVDIWKPIAPTPQMLNNESWDHGVLVRLSDPSRREEGRRQLEVILNEIARAQTRINTQAVIQLVPLREIFAGKVRVRLLLLVAASALLLLTACASIANVLLARAAGRANEFATRVALGASRARMVSQMLTETTLLALAGGGGGYALAHSGERALASFGPAEVQRLAGSTIDQPLFPIAMIISLLTGVACGVVPAWQASRHDPRARLQESARAALGGRAAARSRQLLVGVEVALATMLLASASLLLHSFVKVMESDRGYDVERILAADLSLFGDRYATPQGRVSFYLTLVDNVRGLPGVSAAGAISNLPALSASDGASRTILYPTDTDFSRVVLARPVALIRSVTAGYLPASGSVLRAGRFVADDEPQLAAAISESLAARLWPGEAPQTILGRSLRQGNVTGPLVTIVGVVADAQPGGLDREPMPVVYRPYGQWPSGPMSLVVRTAGEPSALAQAIRSAVHEMDPNLPIAAMRTMEEIISTTVAHRRFQMMLTLLFAFVALLLAAVGVYGVVSHAVASHTREIGLRLALGALRTGVMRSIVAAGMRPVLCGLLVGLIGTIGLAYAMRGLLFGIAPADPVSLGLVVLVLILVSGAACYLPARRAAALDPATALRAE